MRLISSLHKPKKPMQLIVLHNLSLKPEVEKNLHQELLSHLDTSVSKIEIDRNVIVKRQHFGCHEPTALIYPHVSDVIDACM